MRVSRMGSRLHRAPGMLPLRPGGLWQGRCRRTTVLCPAALPAEAVQQGTTIAEIFSGGGPQALLQGLEQLLSVPPAEAYTGAAVAAAAAGGPVVPNALTKISLMLVALAAAAQARDGPADSDDTSAAAAAAGAASQQHSNSADQVPLTYDPEALSAYFRRRPMLVLKRNAVVLSKVASFLGSLAADWQLGKWEANMPMRAKQCVAMLESLGPAFVKIGQATSTRVDVLPEPYLEQLQKLQDKVQVFSSAEARRVLEQELGRPISEVFEWLSDEPVASASLGQVYRGRLLESGQEVAVKVQRPGVLEGAALDIHLMRRALQIYCSMPGAEPEWATVLDEWALRFFGELDYEQEADNTIQFKQQMAHLQGVTVAEIHPELTSRKVLVMSWVSGQRLADVPAADVRPLCTILLNCYLIQLLETGLLHADPHPGNLMMADGKLVVLDFGLMTAVSEDQRIALVEFITNLTMGDWPGVVRDMMRLGFLPHGLPAGQTVEDVAPLMQRVLGPLVAGGGIGGIDAFALHCEMDALAKEFRLVLPPYFTLVLRAFSTIEGIALKASPNYSIVAECMPYLSRRLLTDRDPRMRAALKHLLYGNQSRLDLARLARMVTAFGAFSTAASPSPQQQQQQQQPQQPQPSAATTPQQQPQRRQQLARQQQHSSGGVFPDPFAVAGALFALPAALLGTALASESPFPTPASLAASAAQGLIGQLPGLPLGLSPAGGGFGGGLAGAAAAAAYPGAAGLLPAPAAMEPVVSDSMKEVLQIVFSPDGSFVQELLVDELAAGVDALGREALFEAFSIVASGISGASGLRSSQRLGPLTNLVLPPLPLLRSAQQVLASLAPPVFLTQEDELTLSNIRTLVSLVTGTGLAAGSSSSTASDPAGGAPGLGRPRVYLQAARELAPLVPSLMPGVQATLELFVRQLARRLALRLAADLDPAGAAAATAAAAALDAPPAPAAGGRGVAATAGAGPAAGAPPPRVARY